MTSALEVLQKISEGTYIKLSELDINKIYAIKKIEFAMTTYGQKCLIIMGDGRSCYLPERFNKMSEEQLSELNTQKLGFKIKAFKQTNFGKTPEIDFIDLSEI
jgi:hypothetical protein